MRLRYASLLCALVSLAVCSVHAQGYLYATGTPGNATSLPIDHGIVNVNNGEIHLEIPLASKAQRGAFAVNEKLIYDSRIWKIVQNGGSYSWQPTNIPGAVGGWTFSSGAGLGNITYSTYSGTDSNSPACQGTGGSSPQSYNQYKDWYWTDPSGTTHAFPSVSTVQYQPVGDPHCLGTNTGVPSSSGTASDSSGYFMSVTNYTNAVVTDLQGRTYTPQTNGSNVTDSNGNYWSTDSNGNLVDTSGLTPVLVSSNGNNTYYDVLPVGGGARQRYTVTTTTVSYHTNFGQQGVTDTSGSFSAIQSITLPDGSSYQFTYKSGTVLGNNGELASMTLPTGGVITYGYTNFFDSFNNKNAWISSITRDSGTTSFSPSVVSNCSSSNGCQEQVTVSRPDGNDTVYTFSLDAAGVTAGSSWIQTVDSYQGHLSGGTKLRSSNTSNTYTQYSTETDENGTYYITGSYQVLATQTTLNWLSDINYASNITTTFASGTTLPTEVKSWDFYNAGGYAPTTDTLYQYGPCSQPSSVIVNDGSGNQVSKTTYGYDESTPTATSGVPQHVTGPNHCNQTSRHQWINTSGATLDQTMTYDDTGALLTSADPNGTTHYGYDSTHTFQTSVTPPTPSSGVSLSVSASYDPYTGLITSSTDANSKVTQYKNYDPFGRVREIDYPDGGKTTYTYTANQSSTYSYQNSNAWTDLEVLYDGYGRPYRSATARGGQSYWGTQQDACYDSSSRVNFLSTPYLGNFWSSSKTCSGAGDSYTYDALSRPASTSHADGSSSTLRYTGRAVQSIDENSVQRITQSDAFGRPTIVCEVSSGAGAVNSGPATSCGTDYAGTGYATQYSYNLANHTSTITQGAQVRTSQTDSLNRVVLKQEPESGSTTFSYGYNSTGLAVTRQRPKANQTNASTFTHTTTQYDALGRMVGVSYDDGLTPNKMFNYDASAGWGAFAQTNLAGRLSLALALGNVGGSTYSYDSMGRVIGLHECVPSTCGASDRGLSYTYDQEGNLLTASDGSGVTTSYSNYTQDNLVGSITSSLSDSTHPGNLVGSAQYGAFGVSSYTLGNGLNTVNQYDSMGRWNGGFLCNGSTQSSCTGGSQIFESNVTWRGDQALNGCDTVLNQCLTFGYDEFDRLASRTVSQGTAQNFTYAYDRYGNRWQQNAAQGGPAPSLSFNQANNQISGMGYDAAGNLLSDGLHSYTYDAEGNVVQVDGGSTASYSYDALNHRIRTNNSGTSLEFLFNASGQRVSIWNAANQQQVQGQFLWGSWPVGFYTTASGSTHFQHRDWVGTERMRTSYNGTSEGLFSSLPYGDAFATVNGTDTDAYHFASLDHDPGSFTDHAQYRQYSNMQGRWMSPDPYDGSMNLGNPQSLNRYNYAANNPLSFTDPSGQDPCSGAATFGFAVGGAPGEAVGIGVCIGEIAYAVAKDIEDILGFFNHPQFHGSTKARPNQPWGDHHIPYNGNLANILGLPDTSCEFGACGVAGLGFQNAGTMAAPLLPALPELIAACVAAEPCPLIVAGVAGAAAIYMSKGGKGEVGHDYVRNLARSLGGDYCSALKSIRDAARKRGDSKTFNDAKATYKADCRGYGN